jgi:hypothetical protein
MQFLTYALEQAQPKENRLSRDSSGAVGTSALLGVSAQLSGSGYEEGLEASFYFQVSRGERAI